MICHGTNSLNPSISSGPLNFCRPFSDGPAVFKARALYDLVNTSAEIYYDEDCPEKGYSGRPGLTGNDNNLNVLLAQNESRKIIKKKIIDYVLFPNPAQDRLYLRSKNSGTNLYITITDVLGRVFVSKAIAVSEHEGMLEVNLPNGIYFVSIYDGKKVPLTRKIIISK